MNKYVLDANVFIEAKNRYYGMDFCPAFWDWLLAAQAKGNVCSIDAIFAELASKSNDDEDDLSQWVKTRGKPLFIPHDQEMADRLQSVANWVAHQRYEAAAINDFLDSADMHLIAFAMAHQHTVVTHEKPRGSIKTVKIPNVCAGMKVTCVNPFEMLRTEEARFVMQLPKSDFLGGS